MKVSLISTVMNEEKTLYSFLDSIKSQTRMPDELIIVDGGSSDHTVKIIQEYKNKLPNLSVLECPGVNIAQGRNIAISISTSPIIAVTDGGCRPEKTWLECLVQQLEISDEYAAVAGSFSIDNCNEFEFFSGHLCKPKDSGNDRARLFFGRNSAFRKDAWEHVGGYPEWLYTGEDTLFAMAFLSHAYRVGFAPDAIVWWKPRPSLRKLAKMFFLYGRGNGRIQHGSVKGSLYWLRYHMLLAVTLIGGFLNPWIWFGALIIFFYLYTQIVPRTMNQMRSLSAPQSKWFWVPVIVFVRNMATNAGYIFGCLELWRRPEFRKSLAKYITFQ